MKKLKTSIVLGLMCLILVAAIIVQVKTIKEVSREVDTSLNDNSELKDELLRVQGQNNDYTKELEEKEKKLEKIRTQVASNSEEGTELQNLLKANNALLAKTDVEGPGIVITLDDNREINVEEVIDVSLLLVHEGDLLQIVNELFNSGADAISINEQRITNTTSIQCDGNIIRVNGEMIGVPITIKAIGYPERLIGALTRPQGYLSLMQQDGVIVGLSKSENVKISKYSGTYTIDYIK